MQIELLAIKSMITEQFSHSLKERKVNSLGLADFNSIDDEQKTELNPKKDSKFEFLLTSLVDEFANSLANVLESPTEGRRFQRLSLKGLKRILHRLFNQNSTGKIDLTDLCLKELLKQITETDLFQNLEFDSFKSAFESFEIRNYSYQHSQNKNPFSLQENSHFSNENSDDLKALFNLLKLFKIITSLISNKLPLVFFPLDVNGNNLVNIQKADKIISQIVSDGDLIKSYKLLMQEQASTTSLELGDYASLQNELVKYLSFADFGKVLEKLNTHLFTYQSSPLQANNSNYTNFNGNSQHHNNLFINLKDLIDKLIEIRLCYTKYYNDISSFVEKNSSSLQNNTLEDLVLKFFSEININPKNYEETIYCFLLKCYSLNSSLISLSKIPEKIPVIKAKLEHTKPNTNNSQLILGIPQSVYLVFINTFSKLFN